MAEIVNPHQILQFAQCLTQMQHAVTDYELRHYTELNPAQKRKMEEALAQLAFAASGMYAHTVQLNLEDADSQLLLLRRAADGLKKFLKTAQKIQQVLDTVGVIAILAVAFISHDPVGITGGIDQVIQMTTNT